MAITLHNFVFGRNKQSLKASLNAIPLLYVLALPFCALANGEELFRIGNAEEASDAGDHAPAATPSQVCAYCGVWVPFDSVSVKYSSQDILTISESAIALPGRLPIQAQVMNAPSANKIMFATAYDPNRVLLKINGKPDCSRPINGVWKDAVIQAELFGPSRKEAQELLIDILPSAALDRLMEQPIPIPTPLGSKQMIKRNPPPDSLEKWWFIRSGFNPCDEGSIRGSFLCGKIANKKASDEFGKAWGELMSIADEQLRSKLSSSQKAWENAQHAACVKRTEENASFGSPDQMYFAVENSCWAVAYELRTEEVRSLSTCLRGGAISCADLTTLP
jgi:uncharacterized protein YecT (DUF1311 family)